MNFKDINLQIITIHIERWGQYLWMIHLKVKLGHFLKYLERFVWIFLMCAVMWIVKKVSDFCHFCRLFKWKSLQKLQKTKYTRIPFLSPKNHCKIEAFSFRQIKLKDRVHIQLKWLYLKIGHRTWIKAKHR